MLGYTTTAKREVFDNRFSKVQFLIGDFNIIAYSSNPTQGWFKSGSGTASFKFEETFIKEKVHIDKEEGVIAMDNTIGFDLEKDVVNMQTLDLCNGSMDIYKGTVEDGILIFNNMESGLKAKNKYGIWLTFKLIYKQLSGLENELVVGCSKDNGKTWIPFLKNIYKRK